MTSHHIYDATVALVSRIEEVFLSYIVNAAFRSSQHFVLENSLP